MPSLNNVYINIHWYQNWRTLHLTVQCRDWRVTVKRTALPTLNQFYSFFMEITQFVPGSRNYTDWWWSCPWFWAELHILLGGCLLVQTLLQTLCFLVTNILNQSNKARHNQLNQISFSIPMLIGWQLGQKKSVKTPEMLIVLQGKACNKPSQSFQCQEKAPFVYLGAFSVIVKSSRRFVSTSIARFMQRARWSNSI